MADEGRSVDSGHPKPTTSDDKDDPGNKFANDGSFMEMFRKKMEQEKVKTAIKDVINSNESTDSSSTSTSSSYTNTHTAGTGTLPWLPNNTDSRTTESPTLESAPKPSKPVALPLVGKRRGGAFLKTGAVKKQKKEEKEEPPKKDAWSQYLAEVKKYKEQSCQDENKTRPLVK